MLETTGKRLSKENFPTPCQITVANNEKYQQSAGAKRLQQAVQSVTTCTPTVADYALLMHANSQRNFPAAMPRPFSAAAVLLAVAFVPLPLPLGTVCVNWT